MPRVIQAFEALHGKLTFLFTERVDFVRVATAQGKQGIWLSLFPDRENREFRYNTGKIWTTRNFSNFPKNEVFYSKLPFH